MVIELDAIPWKDRQWGHAIAKNRITTKQKLGLGVSKIGKRRWVKVVELNTWLTSCTNQSRVNLLNEGFLRMELMKFGQPISLRWEDSVGKKGDKISFDGHWCFQLNSWIKLLKEKRSETVEHALNGIFKKGRMPKMLCEQIRAKKFVTNTSKSSVLKRKGRKLILLKMKKKVLWSNVGIGLWRRECGRCSQRTIIAFISIGSINSLIIKTMQSFLV